MSTELTLQTKAINLNDTLMLAEQIGSKLRGGEIIDLSGDLGSGKTTFVRGLAKGMGSKDIVHSPSFTLSNQYKAGKLTLYHFDFYRLDEAGIMHNEISEVLENKNAVVAVEWANVIKEILPSDRLTIKLISTNEDQRQISCFYPAEYQYLFVNT